MPFYMLRSFDHAGYYETRLVLATLGIAVATYFAVAKRDYRYAVMFCSGVFFQSLLEYELQWRGLRGADYSLSVFGVEVPGWLGCSVQGLFEGGILALMGFWFVALVADPIRKGERRRRRVGYLAVCAMITILASVVGVVAAGREITSARPMFTSSSTLRITEYVLASVFVAWWSGGLKYLAYFYVGLLIYVVLNFEPLHLLGARYIGIQGAEGGHQPAPMPEQALVMLVSLAWEVAAAKLYYFAVPFALGLVKFAPSKEVVDEPV